MSPAPTAPNRIDSVDAYRGFVMFLMMAEVLEFSTVATTHPGSTVWRWLAYQQTHAEWAGCHLHDMIQPSFSFLVGVALPFSMASRSAQGQSRWRMTGHALWRSLVLVLLGVFLRSGAFTNWTFEDTLSQIGLGYPFLFVLGYCSDRTRNLTLTLLLAGYWLAWALYPLPPANFDYAHVYVPADWPHHFQGFAAHWNKHSNFGSAFDLWFLNLFPRPTPFFANYGGYLTLSFIPTLGTMLLGLIAGRWLRAGLTTEQRLRRLLIAGGAGLAGGGLLHLLGLCPVVKPIWTPAWTLFSGGLCFWMLAVAYYLVDVRHWKPAAFPLLVIGTNSIAAYCMAWLMRGFIMERLKAHLGEAFFQRFGAAYEPLFLGACVLATYWLILLWMHRRRIFIRL